MLAIFDNGKDGCKYKINGNRYLVPSKIEEGVSTFSSETMNYDGKNYIIGEEAEDYNYSFTKNNLHHKIMLYYCLARHCNPYGEFDIITGCPLATYMNKNEQEKYINYIKNDSKPIIIAYKNKERTFIINNVIIVPESIGGYINDYNESKNKVRGVIDIGGLNINCGIYDKGNPIKGKMFTLNLGTHILIKNIQQAVLRENEEMINYYMCNHYLMKPEDMEANMYKIFDKECYNFVEKIKRTLIKNEWELNRLDLRFIGGGSLLLKKYINDIFDYPYIEKDIFANCEAFEKFGGKKNGKN